MFQQWPVSIVAEGFFQQLPRVSLQHCVSVMFLVPIVATVYLTNVPGSCALPGSWEECDRLTDMDRP